MTWRSVLAVAAAALMAVLAGCRAPSPSPPTGERGQRLAGDRGAGDEDVVRGTAPLERACEAGNAEDCRMLASVHWGGAQQGYYMERACKLGHVPSCGSVALHAMIAEPVRARELFARHCDSRREDYQMSCAFVGDMYAHGLGGARDLGRAALAYDAACWPSADPHWDHPWSSSCEHAAELLAKRSSTPSVAARIDELRARAVELRAREAKLRARICRAPRSPELAAVCRRATP